MMRAEILKSEIGNWASGIGKLERALSAPAGGVLDFGSQILDLRFQRPRPRRFEESCHD
jgi:hypothetical protein